MDAVKKRRTRLSMRAAHIAEMKRADKLLKRHYERLRQAPQYESHVLHYRDLLRVNAWAKENYEATLSYPDHEIVSLDWYETWRGPLRELYDNDDEEYLTGADRSGWWDQARAEVRAKEVKKMYRDLGYHPGRIGEHHLQFLDRVRAAMDAPEIVAIGLGFDDHDKNWAYADHYSNERLKFVFKNDHDAVLFALKWQG